MNQIKRMFDNLKKHRIITTIACTLLLSVCVWIIPYASPNVSIRMNGNNFIDGESVKFYFDIGNGISEEDSASAMFQDGKTLIKLNPIYDKPTALRVDLENAVGERVFTSVALYSGEYKEGDFEIGALPLECFLHASEIHDISDLEIDENGLHFSVVGTDPYFILSQSGVEAFVRGVYNFWYAKVVIIGIIILVAIWILIRFIYEEDEKHNQKWMSQCLVISIAFQMVWGCYAVRNVSDMPVWDGKEPQIISLSDSDSFFVVEHMKNGLQQLQLKVNSVDESNVKATDYIKISILNASGDELLKQQVVPKVALVGEESYVMKLDKKSKEQQCRIQMTDLEDETVGINGIEVQTSGITIARSIWLIIYGFICNLIILCAAFGGKMKYISNRICLLLMYGMVYGVSLFKMWFYKIFVRGFADESYHIGYVAYLTQTNKIIPQFSDMRALSVKGGSAHFASLPYYNYLGHPPLYYHILRLAGAIKPNGNVMSLDTLRLRTFSNVIAMIAIAIVLYIGYSRIRKDRPYWHLFYAVGVMFIPMMVYDLAGINNDVLALLGCSIFFLGMLRFTEGKRGYLTFFLVAIGMCVALLSKLTAGGVLVIITILFTGWYCFSTKNYKHIFCKPFWTTLGVYAVTLFYFGVIYIQTGKIQPRVKDMANGGEYKPKFIVAFESRAEITIMRYFKMFFTKFSGQWTGIVSHITVHHMGEEDSIVFLLRMCVWLLPVLLFAGFTTKKRVHIENLNEAKDMLVKSSYLAIIIIVLMQFYRAMYRFFYVSGYSGGCQSRYYLCVAMILIFSNIYLLEKNDEAIGNRLNWIFVFASAIYMYSDFAYVLTKFGTYWIG